MGCVTYPHRCRGRGCDLIVTYKETTVNERKDAVSIELMGKSDGWISLGFSFDQHMGQDDVYTCIINRYFAIELIHSYNFGRKNYPYPLHGVSNFQGSYSDGYLSCRFTRLKTVPDRRKKHLHDLAREYYFLLPVGDRSRNGTMLKHSKRPMVSKFKAYVRFKTEIAAEVSHDPDDHDPHDNFRYQNTNHNSADAPVRMSMYIIYGSMLVVIWTSWSLSWQRGTL
ncbi:DOMON domain-containing protein FRRS1L-like [Saccoglossus kowalevskii]